MYAYPVIFWVPVAGVKWKWSSDPCIIPEMKQLENTVVFVFFTSQSIGLKKHTQSGNIHFIILDVHALKQNVLTTIEHLLLLHLRLALCSYLNGFK